MAKSKKSQVSDFSLSGQLLGWVIKDGYKVKYLRLTVAEREYWVKVPKELRYGLDPETMIPGCYLVVNGTCKRSLKTGKFKLQAREITLVDGVTSSSAKTFEPPIARSQASKQRILVCRKSSCRKRGGQAVYQALAKALQTQGLESCVEIKETGCLKQCKKGPNLVVMPDKARYAQVQPSEVSTLVDRHFVQ